MFFFLEEGCYFFDRGTARLLQRLRHDPNWKTPVPQPISWL